jgi:hypothetical protein
MLEKLTYPYPIQYNVERYMRSTGEWKLIAEIPITFQIEKKSWGREFVKDRLETLRQTRIAAYDMQSKAHTAALLRYANIQMLHEYLLFGKITSGFGI